MGSRAPGVFICAAIAVQCSAQPEGEPRRPAAPLAPAAPVAAAAPLATSLFADSPAAPSEASSPAASPATAMATSPAARHAALTPSLLALRAEAQARVLGKGAEIEDAEGAVRPPPPPTKKTKKSKKAPRSGENGNALGVFVPVENEPALEAFHAALRKLEAGSLPGGKLRILAYGASHTQADVYTGYLRHYLQSRFGDGGPGFVQMALGRWRAGGIRVFSKGFKVEHAQSRGLIPAEGELPGFFGLAGAAAVGRSPADYASLRRKGAAEADGGPLALEVHAMGDPRGGDLGLFVDGRRRATWSTRAAPPKPLFFSAEAPAGFSELSVRPMGKGAVRFFGVSVERKAPGVVVDTLGISGTRAANWLRWDEAAWTEQIKRREPYLVMLAYGTNESSDEGQPIERYARELGEVLARVRRAAPQASCLLIGPGDASRKVKGAWITRKRISPIIEAQRRKALELGCGFWDARAFMGEGGIERWVRAFPRMASSDRIHLTSRGYAKMGLVLGDALMRAYDAQEGEAGLAGR